MDTVLFIPGQHLPRPRQEIYQQPRRNVSIIAITGNEISGRVIEKYLGIVRGIVVRSPNFTQSLVGTAKTFVGGNNEAFAEVCEGARRDAYARMIKHAADMDADAVIAVRYDATEFAESVTEVLAYGTAVTLRSSDASL